jgi:hypothetical protein
MSYKKVVQVVIHTNGRTDFLLSCIQSMALSDEYFEFILSDNSIFGIDSFFTKIPFLKYRRLKACNTWQEHFNFSLDNCDLPYIVLFHDDDVMFDEFFSSVKQNINSFSGMSIANNVQIINRSRRINLTAFAVSKDKYLFFNSYAERVLSSCFLGFPPISFMVLNVENIKKHRFSQTNGKYGDTLFVGDCLSTGPFLLYSNPVGGYRLHQKQDSKKYKMSDQMKVRDYYSSTVNSAILKKFDARIILESKNLEYLKRVFHSSLLIQLVVMLTRKLIIKFRLRSRL